MTSAELDSKVAVFIQARMGSTRLPGKVLMPLAGRPVLDHVVSRVRASGVGDPVVVTTLSMQDLPIVSYCAQNGVRVFCGSENDVLDRFWQAAKLLDVEHVVRITADCPILDPEILRTLVAYHIDNGNDYSNNSEIETFPDGLDCEIMTVETLFSAWSASVLQSDREHVTPYIRRNTKIYKCGHIEACENLSHYRWTLDTDRDYHFLCELIDGIGIMQIFGMKDVLDFLKKNPGIDAINGGILRNEGYLKSVQQDELSKGLTNE